MIWGPQSDAHHTNGGKQQKKVDNNWIRQFLKMKNLFWLFKAQNIAIKSVAIPGSICSPGDQGPQFDNHWFYPFDNGPHS